MTPKSIGSGNLAQALRRVACAAAGLVLFAGLFFFAGSGQAAERPFPTLVALGWSQPIASSEGLPTPILVADHESGGHYGGGTLAFSYVTAVVKLGMTHPLAEALDVEYRARARYTVEGDARALYVDGNRDSANTFVGDSLALILAGHLFPRAPWRFTAEVESLHARFSGYEDTRRGFDLPSDFRQSEYRLTLSRVGLLGADEAELTLTLVAGEREHWSGWALDSAADRAASYQKQMFHAEQPFALGESSEFTVEFRYLDGEDLDLFSGYGVGGLAGDYPVGGYFRNEFRAAQAAILSVSHQIRFAEDRKLTFYGEAARLREMQLELPGREPERRTLASVGVGYWYGIRSLFGLPVIVRYAEGVLVPDGSKETGRRELVVILAAGF